jgi:hypothetical protein
VRDILFCGEKDHDFIFKSSQASPARPSDMKVMETKNEDEDNVLLTVHHNMSVQEDQQDALFTNSLLRLIASKCFEHLVAHHQEALYEFIQQLVYFVCVVSAGC